MEELTGESRCLEFLLLCDLKHPATVAVAGIPDLGVYDDVDVHSKIIQHSDKLVQSNAQRLTSQKFGKISVGQAQNLARLRPGQT